MFPKVQAGVDVEVGGDVVSEKTTAPPAVGGGKKKIHVLGEKIKRYLGKQWRTILKVGRDDPRKVIHAIKVGVSLTLVSLLYLIDPLFDGVGRNAIWAVMTVVVVSEFTAGATLCKGLNRGFGTFLAGALAFSIEYVTDYTDKAWRAIFIGASVFVIGAASTYARFFPKIKKNYDYGVLIFLLTFNLITVSSYRDEDVLKIANDRFYTIVIGCAICLFMTLLVFPNWSGENLHNSIVSKFEGLAKAIEACVNEYFKDPEVEAKIEDECEDVEDPIYKGYKAVIDSKSTDETLAMHASWEPRHSIHSYRFPWKQYVKVGAALRHLAYTVVALHGCLQTEIQTPPSVRALFKGPCIQLAGEVSKALRELANSIKNRSHCSPEILSYLLNEALQDLNKAINSQPRLFLGPGSKSINQTSNILALAAEHASQNQGEAVSPSSANTDTSAPEQPREKKRKMLRPQLSKLAIESLEFSEALPFAAFAFLLVETVARLDNVIEEVEELGRIGCFKEFRAADDNIVVTSEKPNIDVAQNKGTD